MKVREFVAMQITYDHAVRFDVDHDGRVDAYTVRNAGDLGEREVVGWELDPGTGRMRLLVADGKKVDLVSAELPSGAELSERWGR